MISLLQPLLTLELLAKKKLDLRVEAPQLVIRPSLQSLVDLRVQPQQKCLPVAHDLSCRVIPR